MRKKSDKILKPCVVCGDKAKGLNFNALTCQSCKAFFRRNALSNKELKCSFNNSCSIDKITRKFCSCCRLRKCFEMGMKKEWILTEEEKRLIREKIIQNRIRRQQQQSFPQQSSATNDENLLDRSNTSSTTSTTSGFDTEDSTSVVVNEQLNNVVATMKTLNPYATTAEIHLPFNNYIDSLYNAQTRISNLNLPPPAAQVDGRYIISTTTTTTNPNLLITQSNDHYLPPPSTTTNTNYYQDELMEMNFQIIKESESSESIDAQLPINLTTFTTNTDDKEQCFSTSSISNVNDDDPMTSTTNVIPETSTQTTTPIEDHTDNNKNYIENYLLNSNNGTYSFDSYFGVYNIDPIIELSSKLEQTIFSYLDESYFSSKEKCTLKELCSACTLLHNPYKRMLILKHQTHVKCHQCTIVDSFLHRLICMSKRLSTFSQLKLTDQTNLLKSGLIEMLSLRSVLIFDPHFQTWTFMDDKCKLSIMAYMDAIQPCCIKYDYKNTMSSFFSLFKHEWRVDYIIFDLLTAIVLFTERPGIIERDKIRDEKNRYTDLLKRYLDIKYPTTSEARWAFDRLMLSMKSMQLLRMDLQHIIASTIGSECTPLLLQLMSEPGSDDSFDFNKDKICNIDLLWSRSNKQTTNEPGQQQQQHDTFSTSFKQQNGSSKLTSSSSSSSSSFIVDDNIIFP